jgi:pimeloyl-ACP methyl ester carboxylesterase
MAGYLVSTVLIADRAPRAAASLAACTTPTDACARWITLGGGPGRTMVYATHALDGRNDTIKRALIMVHGTNRNADHYFATATAAAFLAGALDDTIVIAPHIVIPTDTLAPNEISWPSGGDSWRAGGASPSHPGLFAFDIVDELLRTLATKSLFPNMQAIVVSGHSAGGQYATRYAMANKVHDTLGVPVTYVVANPSSYAWPDATRPLPQDDAEPAAAKDGWSLMPETTAHTKFTFGAYDAVAKNCAPFNRWPLGLENRSASYTSKQTDEQLKKQLASRPTTFVLGQVDTLPLGGFDSSCGAMAQGPTRRSRGEAFVKYVNATLGAQHKIQIVPECGHNDRCIFTTDVVFPLIFPAVK